jgi:hypothetical protein
MINQLWYLVLFCFGAVVGGVIVAGLKSGIGK